MEVVLVLIRTALLVTLLGVVPLRTTYGGGMATTRQALDAAPQATVEKLGVVQTLGRLSVSALSPGTEDYPPRYVISFWSMADRSFYRTFVVDLTTGEPRMIESSGLDTDAPRWPLVQAQDGKWFFSSMRGGLAVYDPAADRFEMVHPCPGASWLRGLAVGGDGAIYVSGYPKGDSGRYDPATGETEYYGPQGGPFQSDNICGYSVGAEGEWVYTAAGKIPWYVVAYNRKTKEQTNLLQFGQADFPNVRQVGRDVYLTVSIVDQQANASRVEHYRLVGGEAKPVKQVPAAPKVERASDSMPQPEVESPGRALPMRDGNAILRYRPAGAADDAPWLEVRLPLPGEPYEVRRIAPMGDGRLLVATGIYGDVFLFDPKTETCERIGNPANRNVYCLLAKQGTIYFGGYANAFLGRFEGGEGKLLFDWNRMLGSKRSLDMVAGADGKLYLGCQAEREFVGGALAWWDPEAPEGERAGGLRFPNDEAKHVIAANGGKHIVVSTESVVDPANPDHEPPGGKVIVYGTEEQKIVSEFVPFPGEEPKGNWRGEAGLIAEASPGIVLGLTTFRGDPVMYIADYLAGKRLQTVELPATAGGDLKRGPDGMLYTFLGETLVRIEPRSLAITPMGKAKPGRMAFLGGDLYLAGDCELRRIKGVAQ